MTEVWRHEEFGHKFRVMELPLLDSKGRKYRLYDNGSPALGGQWHYTIDNAKARARYVLQGSYSRRIAYLELRVQNLERKLYHDRS